MTIRKLYIASDNMDQNTRFLVYDVESGQSLIYSGEIEDMPKSVRSRDVWTFGIDIDTNTCLIVVA